MLRYLSKGILSPRFRFTSLSGPPTTSLLEEVEAKVFQVLYSTPSCNREQLDKSVTFRELGMDSLDGVEAVSAMQEAFGLSLTEAEALRIESVGVAIEVFFSHMNERMINKLSHPIRRQIK